MKVALITIYYLYRKYARSQSGKLVYGKVNGRKYQRTSIAACQQGKKIISPLQYSGTMYSELFEFWFDEMLLPKKPLGTVIIMDNASFSQE